MTSRSQKKGLECELLVNGMGLEHVSEIKYFLYFVDKSGTDEVECRRKVASGRKVTGAIKSLVKAGGLHL